MSRTGCARVVDRGYSEGDDELMSRTISGDDPKYRASVTLLQEITLVVVVKATGD